MPSKDKDWDEDPWERPTGAEQMSQTPGVFSKERSFAAQKTQYGYQVSTVSAAVIKAIRDSVREEVGSTVDLAYQRIMDRLDELEAEITRER